MSQANDKLRAKLFRWYQDNQRVLPWRGCGDPYKIWLSEVIMQQTRVAQGTPYYLKFTENYPTIAALAAAEEQEVLKLWQGLGYYSRGRNLLNAARQIMQEHDGVFPSAYKDVIKLKGIGPYTAAAIVSIAYNQPYAVLDGNVYRVLSRLYALEIPINASGAQGVFQKHADALLDKDRPGVFNEAMMELGATVCLPKNPICAECPISVYCMAKKEGLQETLPRKLASKSVKTRYFHYLFIMDGLGKFAIRQRPTGDIWQGLYELPMIETATEEPLSAKKASDVFGSKVTFLKPLKSMVHKLTHQRLQITFYEAETISIPENAGFVVDFSNLKQYPLPRPLELFLNDYLCKIQILDL